MKYTFSTVPTLSALSWLRLSKLIMRDGSVRLSRRTRQLFRAVEGRGLLETPDTVLWWSLRRSPVSNRWWWMSRFGNWAVGFGDWPEKW